MYRWYVIKRNVWNLCAVFKFYLFLFVLFVLFLLVELQTIFFIILFGMSAIFNCMYWVYLNNIYFFFLHYAHILSIINVYVINSIVTYMRI